MWSYEEIHLDVVVDYGAIGIFFDVNVYICTGTYA